MTDHNRLLEFISHAKNGHRPALNDVCESMRGLVRRLAISFHRNDSRAELDDLIQEGLLAVVDAVRWFDQRRGFRFSTYAGDCIRRRMARYAGKRCVQPLPQEPANSRGGRVLESIPERPRLETDRSDELEPLLATLDPKRRLVIAMRYGIGERPASIHAIGERLGMPPALVRTLCRSGKRALKRHSARIDWGRSWPKP